MQRYRWYAAATLPVVGVTAALTAAGLTASGSPGDVAWATLAAAAGLPAVVLGNLIAAKLPGNRVGPLLAWSGVAVGAVGALDTYAAGVGVLPMGDVAVSVLQGSWMWLYVPIALLMLFFPTGHLPSARWRPVAVLLPLTALLFTALAATLPAPYLPPHENGRHALGTAPAALIPLAWCLIPLLFGSLVAAAASMAVRYRRSTGVVRAQLRWVAVAGLTLPATLLLCWVSYLLVGSADLVGYAVLVMNVAVPVAVAIAVVRHDLFDVDRLLSATVTYGLVSACVVAVYAVTSGALGVVLGGESAARAALATAAAAAALAPVHRSVRAAVYRQLFPLRERVLDAIEDLRRRTLAGAARPEDLAATLRLALNDPGLQVGYLPPRSAAMLDAVGSPLEHGHVGTPVVVGGQEVGLLVPSRPVPAQLAAEIAAASGMLVEIVALRLEAGMALTEAELSKARLLRAGYDERRRVVQDLHDGSQQRLVSLGLALRLAQRHLPDGSVDVDGLLEHSVTELGAVVAELRQLANGLRPSCLDDGLDAALLQLTSAVPIALDLDLRAGPLADDVSTTAYFVASEALANAVKHADAARLHLAVVRREDHLHIRMSDDGLGGAAVRSGHGLSGLVDRLSAHGGSLAVRSEPGSGTVVDALLPCG